MGNLNSEIETERERELNKTSQKHFHVSPCWPGCRKPNLDPSSGATKTPVESTATSRHIKQLKEQSVGRKSLQTRADFPRDGDGKYTCGDHQGNDSPWEVRVLLLWLTSTLLIAKHTQWPSNASHYNDAFDHTGTWEKHPDFNHIYKKGFSKIEFSGAEWKHVIIYVVVNKWFSPPASSQCWYHAMLFPEKVFLSNRGPARNLGSYFFNNTIWKTKCLETKMFQWKFNFGKINK